jgi:nucleotide-binding universal stress UspA family protein
MGISDPAPAQQPVTVEDTSRHRIVVGVDGSDSSIDALRWAGRIAAAMGVEIDAVICWKIPMSFGYAQVPFDYQPDKVAEQVLIATLTAAFGETRPGGLRALVRDGHPATVLVDAGKDAEMLVLGSRGHGGFVGLLLGSVSAYCAEHALCPVVVVRQPTVVTKK